MYFKYINTQAKTNVYYQMQDMFITSLTKNICIGAGAVGKAATCGGSIL